MFMPIALAAFLAIGIPASAGTATSVRPADSRARAAAVMVVNLNGKLIGRAAPAQPNANPITWKIVGQPCKDNPYSWCDLFGHIVVGNFLDEYTVRFKFDPHWQSVDVIWRVITHNAHNYLSDFQVVVHVLCLSNRDCRDREHALGGEGGSSFKVQYPENLRGRDVTFGVELDADCSRCAPGFRHPAARGRTRFAKCLKSKDKCRFA